VKGDIVTLVTGLPGAGKSLFLVSKVPQWYPGQTIYYWGIPGLNKEKLGWIELEDPKKWAELPPESVLVWDECQREMPSRGSAAKEEPWVEEFSRIRHKGLEVVLVTQHPRNMSLFMRGLVRRHFHLKRLWGSQKAMMFEHDAVFSPDSATDMKVARSAVFSYPKQSFELYKSAEVHTVTRRLPWQIYATAVLGLFVLGAVYMAYKQIFSAPPSKKPAPGQVVAGAPGPAPQRGTTGLQLAIERQPVDHQFPETAPVYAEVLAARKAVDYPRIAGCFAMESLCRCWNQQGLPYRTTQERCELYLREGGFDPYRSVRQAATSAAHGAVSVLGVPSVTPASP
jgi:zona occludens toxin